MCQPHMMADITSDYELLVYVIHKMCTLSWNELPKSAAIPFTKKKKQLILNQDFQMGNYASL